MQSSPSLTSSPPPSPPSPSPPRSPRAPRAHAPIASPCAACKFLRRRCVEQCVLAPYFPPSDPQKFITTHRVFGACNIIKLLQDIPESHRADAVSSLVYEANVRSRDPVYGCAGVIFQLQKQLSELQSQLAMAQAEILMMQTQHANMVALLCMEMAQAEILMMQTQQANMMDLLCMQMAQAEILMMQTQQANMVALLCLEMAQSQQEISQPSHTASGNSNPGSYQLQFQQGKGGFFDAAAAGVSHSGDDRFSPLGSSQSCD